MEFVCTEKGMKKLKEKINMIHYLMLQNELRAACQPLSDDEEALAIGCTCRVAWIARWGLCKVSYPDPTCDDETALKNFQCFEKYTGCTGSGLCVAICNNFPNSCECELCKEDES